MARTFTDEQIDRAMAAYSRASGTSRERMRAALEACESAHEPASVHFISECRLMEPGTPSCGVCGALAVKGDGTPWRCLSCGNTETWQEGEAPLLIEARVAVLGIGVEPEQIGGES